MGDIFISCHSDHLQEADALMGALEAAGFSCQRVAGTQVSADDICLAIYDCPVFVLLLTSQVQEEEPPQVARELNLAMYQDKLIMPIGPSGLTLNDFFQFCLCFATRYTGDGDWFLPPQAMINHIRDYLTLVRAVHGKGNS